MDTCQARLHHLYQESCASENAKLYSLLEAFEIRHASSILEPLRLDMQAVYAETVQMDDERVTQDKKAKYQSWKSQLPSLGGVWPFWPTVVPLLLPVTISYASWIFTKRDAPSDPRRSGWCLQNKKRNPLSALKNSALRHS